MLIILSILQNILDNLKKLKSDKKIEKFHISINNSNEISVLIVSNTEIKKEDLSNKDFNITIISTDELNNDDFYLQLFVDNDEIVDFENTRKSLRNLLGSFSSYEPPIPIVTYYSYKGGMGRSTNLVITATYLARHFEKKVVIIDCDFEAPGFSNFFLENPSEPKYQNGLLEFFLDSDFDSEINLENYSWEVSKEVSQNGEIKIFPAGNLDFENLSENSELDTNLKHYLEALARIDFSSSEYILNKFQALIDLIHRQINPDLILIDSRTGFTDIFGLAALNLSSHVVGFFSNSVQNEPGIYQFIDSLIRIPFKKPEFRAIIVNAFSDSDFFEEFQHKVNYYIEKITERNNVEENLFFFTPDFFFFRYNSTLSELGTSREKRRDWLEQIDEKSFSKGYSDLSEKINQIITDYSFSRDLIDDSKINIKEINSPSSNTNDSTEFNFVNSQSKILNSLDENWPELYADSGIINFQDEFDNKRFFFRDSMKDLFNFDKFIVLGNKGTGKSYLFQALKNHDIANELKTKAQKTHLKIHFLHLVDKKENYFISTNGFESFKSEIDEIGDFYSKFWKVYTWSTIISKIKVLIDFQSKFSVNELLNLENRSLETSNIKKIVAFISNIDNIINVENELVEIDIKLNSRQIDIIAIYDNLDLMVAPNNWKDQMAPLLNFWNYSNYKRIHSKLFLRSDLFKKIIGINNSQALKNNIISIEWQKEEIFNYFFNLVKLYANSEFIQSVETFNFKNISSDAQDWIQDFLKSFKSSKQKNLHEYILRRLCWVFFGQYPDIKAHGESYDWLYKNVMNADETISLRPFIDLLKLSIHEFKLDNFKDSSSILPNKYYTAKNVRQKAVNNHFTDLVSETGNENLDKIFEFIDDNQDYKYYEFLQKDFTKLLSEVKEKYLIADSIKELEELLIINGIVKRTTIRGNNRFSFAFLYKYRLGLRNRPRWR